MILRHMPLLSNKVVPALITKGHYRAAEAFKGSLVYARMPAPFYLSQDKRKRLDYNYQSPVFAQPMLSQSISVDFPPARWFASVDSIQ